MSEKLLLLIEKARLVRMTPQEIEDQRTSFAYGNAHYEDDRTSRDRVAYYSALLTATESREKSRF